MELINLRNVIVKLLHEHTKRPVVMIKQAQDKPLKEDKANIDYPFIAYNFLTTFIKDKEMGSYKQEQIKSDNPNFKNDIMETVILQAQFTMSFSIYGKNSIESKNTALKAWEFFKHIGYYELLRHNIVVV